jgi:type IV secretory pathway VirB3-like protein
MAVEDEVNYSFPVHVSLMEKSVMFGVGTTVFCVIMMVTVVLMAMVSASCVLLGVVMLLVCRQVCKKDNLTLEFMFQNLGVQDVYRG